ncbi:MlaD family protein [Syntrophobacter fumaroxidans]|uniref:Mammalian cell entry related domain protein n=1 Tax=Syntrophobacter fumaroxidans (strain DSM 10017 / MPOB) TaxID=335543 RepID=A0LL26_SYNFM|nr:MlaD family protein [Syntrophobacter fumaroxidans]ABK18128.1 Mammalian cell entry related domain protein [Syntrophobacter fumaroxidans MPOB]
MQVFRSEIRVGLLILVSFVVLMAGIFAVSDLRSLWYKKKTIELLFPYADGITKGSPVWYAGLEVGEVSNIRIAQGASDRIAVTVTISPDARVRKDSRADIRNLGMMGAKYVEISPGSPDAELLGPGETLEGKGPSSLSEVMETGHAVVARLGDLINETHKLVREVRTESALTDAIRNANGFLVDMRDNGKDLKKVLAKISAFAENLKETSGEGGKDLRALLKELRETNRGLQKRLESVENRINETLAQIGQGVAEAQSTVKVARSMLTSSQEDVASMFRHLSGTSRNLEGMSEDLRAHPWKIVWKEDGTFAVYPAQGTDQWREKGRIGPHGKQ